jgi:mutator protein MutT
VLAKPLYQVAAALIQKEKKFLITQRLDQDKCGGLWEFPGGKQEPGESLEACLVREIYEELAIKISIKKYLFNIEHNYHEARISLHLFHCDLENGAPQCREVQNWKWVEFSAIKDYQFAPADEKVAQRLVEYV